MQRKTFISNLGKSIAASLISSTIYSCSKREAINVWGEQSNTNNSVKKRLYELVAIYWVEDNEKEKISNFVYVKHIVKIYERKSESYSPNVRVRNRGYGIATYNEKDIEGKLLSIFSYESSKAFELFSLNKLPNSNVKPKVISQRDFHSLTQLKELPYVSYSS